MDLSKLKIENDVPPAPRSYGRSWEIQEFLRSMQPGQSFLFDDSDVALVRYQAKKLAASDPAFDWEMRRESPKHMRFWRVKIHH